MSEITDADGFSFEARPLCPFCSQRWTAKMMDMFARTEVETGYYGSPERVEATIDITCDGCERVIYRKEVVFSAYEYRQLK